MKRDQRPYAEYKRQWDKLNRRPRLEQLKKATRWADEQLRVLRTIGGEQERDAETARKTRKELRRALISQYYQDSYGTGHEAPMGTPPADTDSYTDIRADTHRP